MLRFRLLSLFSLTFVVAGVLAMIRYVPLGIAEPILLFITVAAPAIYSVGIFYGKGNIRPFCIAAVFPHLAVFIRVSQELERAIDWGTLGVYDGPPIELIGISVPTDHWRRMMGAAILAGVITGVIGVAFRTFLTWCEGGENA